MSSCSVLAQCDDLTSPACICSDPQDVDTCVFSPSCIDPTDIACVCQDLGDVTTCSYDQVCVDQQAFATTCSVTPTCSDSTNPACSDGLYHANCLDSSDLSCICTDLINPATCTLDSSCNGDLSTCASIKPVCDSTNDACICSSSGACELAPSCYDIGDLACVCGDLSDPSTCQLDVSCGTEIATCSPVVPTCTDVNNPACICSDYNDDATCEYFSSCLDGTDLACICGDITDPSTCAISTLCTSISQSSDC